MRTPSKKTKSKQTGKSKHAKKKTQILLPKNLKALISMTTKLWRKEHLTYDQARYVSKEVRKALAIKRVKTRQRVIERLSREEERKLIGQAYKARGEYGLLIKTQLRLRGRSKEF